MPLPWVPKEVLDEFGFKNPIELGFLVQGPGFFGHFECCVGAYLGEDADLAIVVSGDGEGLMTRGLDAAAVGGLFEFNYIGFAWGGF